MANENGSEMVGARLPTALAERIDKMAADEQRSRSNMVVVLLTEALAARKVTAALNKPRHGGAKPPGVKS